MTDLTRTHVLVDIVSQSKSRILRRMLYPPLNCLTCASFRIPSGQLRAMCGSSAQPYTCCGGWRSRHTTSVRALSLDNKSDKATKASAETPRILDQCIRSTPLVNRRSLALPYLLGLLCLYIPSSRRKTTVVQRADDFRAGREASPLN